MGPFGVSRWGPQTTLITTSENWSRGVYYHQGLVRWYSSSRDAKHPTILCHACDCFDTLLPGLMEDFFVGDDVVVR
ncbi:unnamed protein product [Ascophyllum nodosum]